MPQLDFATYSPQLIWLVISFVALYLIMARVALPRIATVIEERRDRIADDLDQAEEFKRQAEQALAAYEKAIGEARGQAQAIMAEVRETLREASEKRQAEIDGKLMREIEEAEARIAQAKNAALSHIRDVGSESATLIVERLMGAAPDRDSVSAAVEAVLERTTVEG